MAWSALVGSNVGTFADSSASTSYTFSTGSSLAAGNVILLWASKDNAASTSGNTNEFTSVTDANSNTWTKIREYCNAQGGAGNGVTTSLWMCQLAGSMASGTNITLNFSTSVVAKTAVMWAFSVAAGSTVSVAANATDVSGTAASPASQTISGLTSGEYLFIRGIAAETNSFSFTATTSYTGTGTNATSTGGATNTNVEVAGEFRILTGTGDTVNSSTNAVDTAAIYVALKENLAVPFLKDYSSYNHTFTAVGSAAESTTESRFGGGSYSCTSTAALSNLNTPDSTDWDLSSGDFTIEAQVRPDSGGTSWASASRGIVTQWLSSGVSVNSWALWVSSGKLTFSYTTNGTTLISLSEAGQLGASDSGSSVLKMNQWNHVVAERSGSTLRLYCNGVVVASASIAVTIFSGTQSLYIGAYSSASGLVNWYGQIDEVRISKSVARYNGAFTPPTSPFTSDANTFLLMHMETTSTSTGTARSNQVAVEVINQPVPAAQSWQVAVEVVNAPNPNLQLQQSVAEVVVLPANPSVQLSQSVIEVIRQNGTEGPITDLNLTGIAIGISQGSLTVSIVTPPVLPVGNDSPVFPQGIINPCAQILPADTTAYKTLRTASTNGDVIDNIIVTSNDTADRMVLFAINDGTTDHVIGEVAVPALSGRDGSGVVKGINVLITANFPGMHPDGKLYLKSGYALKVKSEATLTASKQIDVVSFGRFY
jgi:hypothetical protein